MGKFRIKVIEKRLKEKEKENKRRLKEIFKRRELIKFIPPKASVPTDGVLLFGSHNGEKVSELLAGFRTAPYVLNYLAQNKDFPVKFRKKIKLIIENYDPFESEISPYKGLSIREMGEGVGDEDDIPW